MKLSLIEHGGWGAGLRRRPLTVDTAALPPAAAQALCDLAEAAERAQAPERAAPPPGGDAMSFEITLDRDGRAVTLTGSDLAASPELQALADSIREHAAKTAGAP